MILGAVCQMRGDAQNIPADREQIFSRLESKQWRELFFDSCRDDWTQRWTLDGINASVKNTPEGMIFSSGPKPNDNAHHAVLWTKASFVGDLRIEYDYTRLDSSKANSVNIVYIQAQGDGSEGFDRDISLWADKRREPAMKLYYNHMNTYHISYATSGVDPSPEAHNYVRARRYMPDSGRGLDGTDLTPDYMDVNLFDLNVTYHFTIIKSGSELFFRVQGGGAARLFYFDGTAFPPITEGRIGLRQMASRSSRYANFTIAALSASAR